MWNGKDPILKERIFGLTGNEGNHGEDAKEYWWYLDSTPTHSWMRWRYHYPQAEFPYAQLLEENRRRGRGDFEYELLDTGVFDANRYWQITMDVAKAAPEDICIRVELGNMGPEPATIDLLPTIWFRNTWAWGSGKDLPTLHVDGQTILAEHRELGTRVLTGAPGAEILFCDNETNTQRLWGVPGRSRYPKDGINDHVVFGASTVNPERTGTKAAFRYHLTVGAGEAAEIRLRLSDRASDLGTGFSSVLSAREREADAFYALLTPPDSRPDETRVMRQAFGGMLWSKQFYQYDVARWLDGDPGGPPPPDGHRSGRNAGWRHLDSQDVISMPDKWEYPWFAAWDLAFHCVALAHIDPQLAKDQLKLLTRPWYMSPPGQLPAYEWAFSDVNPPVHASAAVRVFEIDQSRDYEFLEAIFHKLLLNFTWWVNRKDVEGNNVFEGGFLGLDNIGPIDRSATLPVAGHLEQSDGTAWMAMFCLDMLELSLLLAQHDRTYEEMAVKFFEHFTYIATAMNEMGLWDEGEGFYYDVLHLGDGRKLPLRVRSMVGLIPFFAVTTLGPDTLERLGAFRHRMRWFLDNKPEYAKVVDHIAKPDAAGYFLLSIVGPERLRRLLRTALDETEFLSPYGLRSVSRFHLEHPFSIDLGGMTAQVDYEPAESTSGLFGGNSNWRGPVWFPLNYLFIEGLRRFHRYLGDGFQVEHPTGSGRQRTLGAVADDLSRRLVTIFLDDDRGRRPVFGGVSQLQTDPAWHDSIPFNEYFHGDNGAGLGASHQTGWTGLVADLITRRRPR